MHMFFLCVKCYIAINLNLKKTDTHGDRDGNGGMRGGDGQCELARGEGTIGVPTGGRGAGGVAHALADRILQKKKKNIF